jgi:hypothetical protein
VALGAILSAGLGLLAPPAAIGGSGDSASSSIVGAEAPASTDEAADEGPRAVEVSLDESADDRDYVVGAPEYGPFFEPPPPSEVTYPSHRPGTESTAGVFSVGQGAFCFVEDAPCKASLIADASVGAGLNVVGSERGVDVPLTQFRVRGGVTIRPLTLAKKRWHPWSLGLIGNWSQASPQVRGSGGSESLELIRELDRLRSFRVGLVNQIWLKNRRNAVHLDFTFGGVNTGVLDAQGTFWGTTAEAAVGWAGWGGVYASLDFLDRDTRMIFGFRTHAMAAAPIVGALLIGLLAGGAL